MCFSLEVDLDLEKLSKKFNAIYSSNTKKVFEGEFTQYKLPFENKRAYKDDYIPAIIFRNNRREIVPLRFNLLPHFSKSPKYGMLDRKSGKFKEFHTYNATIERVKFAKAYKSLFMKRHCLIPVKGFYEWIYPNEAKKPQEAYFYHKELDWLVLAGLWDSWKVTEFNSGINSCSVITTPPRKEVEEAGHDRSPLILADESIGPWVLAKNKAQIDKAIWHPQACKLNFSSIKPD